ncbi:MAG: HD domain-containing protein [Clostridia bacterium]|nr:HD domain-containing protein [Clostridia bacterium]
MIEKEFYAIIRDIVKSEAFCKMKGYRHHVKSNIYKHSVRVAYLCYRHHKRHNTRVDLQELVRGALLHDFYLYDWHEMLPGRRLHLLTHPKVALQNALQAYPSLTPIQQDMIRHHMFPILPLPPKSRAAWLVCFYDKVAALCDYLGK